MRRLGYEMDRAINKTTGELVSAFEVFKNGSYQEIKKGDWLAPEDSISNSEEELCEKDLHVHYVKEKEYKNYRGTLVWCNPYFAIYPGSKANTYPESKEHKALKIWLFNRMRKDDLQFTYSKAGKKNQYKNTLKLSEMDIDWNKYDIEVHTKGYKALRADILLTFKNKHPFLGSGIFFEIQLSSQKKETTFNRSISRAIQGYSTVWLFKKDFEFSEDLKEIELKNNELRINSFSSELKYGGSIFIKKLKYVVEEQCRYLDKKIKETNIAKEELDERKEEVINELLERLNSREAILFNKIKSLEGNPFEQLVVNYKKDISNKSNVLLEKFSDRAEYVINEIEELQRKYQPKVIPCPKCERGSMIFTISKIKKMEFYKCNNCENINWL